MGKKDIGCFYLLPFFGPSVYVGVIRIYPLPTPVATATNFGTN